MNPLFNHATRLSVRHKESGENSRFDFSGGSFSEYAAQTRAKIAHARANAGWCADPRLVDWNAPFECSPEAPGFCNGSGEWGAERDYREFRNADGRAENGVLLIHGLTDSPFLVRDLARYFVQRRGFLARAVLLPGHGTVPGDLLQVRWREWAKAVRFGIDSMRGEVRRLYLAGFSAGAALAVLAALEEPRVDGLLLFSPALRVSPMAALAGLHKIYSWALPEARWLALHEDRDPVKYESFANNAVVEVLRLTVEVRRSLSRASLTAPMFVAQSEGDATTSTREALRFFRNHNDPRSRMLLFVRSAGSGGYVDRIRRISATAPALRDPGGRIMSFAHICLPVHPLNPHYGRQGDYRDCLHYEGSSGRFADMLRICCSDDLFAAEPNAAYGEMDQLSERVVLRRLTYNPHFDRMTEAIDEFLAGLA